MLPPELRLPAQEKPQGGRQFLAEIHEQPKALRGLLEHASEFERVAAIARERGTSIVRMVGHGSSDNAASYGVYAFGLLPGWTALRDSISLTVYYKAAIDMRPSIAIGLSQSGRTPDVVEYIEHARAAGALTIAITNEPDSELGVAAEAVLPLGAGAEQAIVATKTYMNQIAALGLLAAHVAGKGDEFASHLRAVAEQQEELIPVLERQMTAVATPFAFVGRMFVIGRGVELASARETALKLLEGCRITAEPLTVTDLAHGPLAALDPLFPVWMIATNDQTLPADIEAARRIRATGATLVACGDAAGAIGGADYVISLPLPPSPLVSPLLSIVPGQLFTWSVARAKGIDPDRPRGLSKVTLAL